MRVLFVISSLTSGGAERVLTRLANYWISKGWSVTILAILSHDKDFYILNKQIEVISLDIRYKNFIFNNLWYLYGIRNTIKKGDFNVVISFLSIINILTLISSIGLKIPVIISERNNFYALRSKFWRILRRLIYPLADNLVVLSKYDYNKYTFVNKKKIIFNPLSNLIDVKLEDKEKIILAVGSLTKQKGYNRFFKALSLIDLKDWKVLIIGEGPKENELNSILNELNLSDKVKLIGRRKDINEFYKKASIFVLSSFWEGFPNVLSEAMGMGVACVSFDCITGPSNIIEDEFNGFLVEQNNIDMLSKKISLLIDNIELREKFFYNGLKIRDRLNIEKIVCDWEDIIFSLNKG